MDKVYIIFHTYPMYRHAEAKYRIILKISHEHTLPLIHLRYIKNNYTDTVSSDNITKYSF